MTLSPATSRGSAGALTQVYDNVASGAIASWDVTGIAASYNHLRLVIQARGDTVALAANVLMRLNGDTGANYDYQSLLGRAAAVTALESFGATSIWLGDCPAASAGAGLGNALEATIPNYAATVFNKEISSASGSKQGVATTNLLSQLNSGGWRSTAAVSQVTVFPSAGNFIAGSRLTIYALL